MPHMPHHAPPPEEWELREAVEGGDVDSVKALLDRGANIEGTDAFGRTPLHTAIISGHEELACLLVDRGAAIEALDVNGRTPLHWAAAQGRVRLAALLLNHGAHREAHHELHSLLKDLAAAHGHKSLDELQRAHTRNG